MKARSITRAVFRMNLTSTGDGDLQPADPDRHCRCPAPDAQAAGRVADGLAGHPLFTTTYVEEIVRPAIARVPRTPAAPPMTWKSFPW